MNDRERERERERTVVVIMMMVMMIKMSTRTLQGDGDLSDDDAPNSTTIGEMLEIEGMQGSVEGRTLNERACH